MMSQKKRKVKCLAKTTEHNKSSLRELPEIVENCQDSAEPKMDGADEHKVLFEMLVSIGEKLDLHRQTFAHLSEQLSVLSAAEIDLTMNFKDTLSKFKQLRKRAIKTGQIVNGNQMDSCEMLIDESELCQSSNANTQICAMTLSPQAQSCRAENLKCPPHPMCNDTSPATLQQHPTGKCHLPAASKPPFAEHLSTLIHTGSMQKTMTTPSTTAQVSRQGTQVGHDELPPLATQQQQPSRGSDQPPYVPSQQEQAGSDATPAFSAPISCNATLQLPMVEIADSYGDITMVQRMWTPDEIAQYANTLGTPAELGGEKWQNELKAFCKTYRPTMREVLSICAKNIDPSKMHDIMVAMEIYRDTRPVASHYDQNYRFLAGLQLLCQEIMRLYPKRVNLEAVQTCQQGKDENISDFYHRLQTALNTQGGFGDMNSPIAKSYLTSLLLTNMHEEMSVAVKTSLIEADFADPIEVLRHARYAEKRANEKKKRRKADARALQLSMTENQLSMKETFKKMDIIPACNQLTQTVGHYGYHEDDSSDEDTD